MKSMLKNKLVSLVAVLALLLVTITGCGSANKLDTTIVGNEEQSVSSDYSSTLDNDQTSNENISESETTTDTNKDDSSETILDNIAGDTTENTTENQTSSSTSDIVEPPTKRPGITSTQQSTTKKPDTTTSQQTTTKKPDATTSQQTTTKKPASTTTQQTTTKKPASTTTQQTTTKKPSPWTEQTTTASGSSNLSNAEKMAKEIVDTIIKPGMSDFEKAITIHDWLIFNLDYDFTYSNYYVEETLRDRKCVCQGYALTFEMMCEMAGLEVTFVGGTGTNSSGQTESHAWNQVKIDGKWYNVDVTWDDPARPGKNPNDHSANRYDYFLISDVQMYKNHTTNTSGLKTCSANYDTKTILKYAASNGMYEGVYYADDISGIALAIKNAVESNYSQLSIWYYDTTVTQNTMWDVLWDGMDKAVYPSQTKPSYAPSNGVTKYILSVTPLSEFNKIAVGTSASEITSLIDSAFDSGATTFTVRYEPADGNMTVYSKKYAFRYSSSTYNNGKSMLMMVTLIQDE